MRPMPIVLLCLVLSGCASPLPPVDPNMAWIDLAAQPSDVFMADRLDGKRLDDGRYFQVSPGAHDLEASYRFEINSGFGLFGDPHYLRCQLLIRYDNFQPGRRYRFDARSLGFRPQGWLRDERHQVLAKARELRCGP